MKFNISYTPYSGSVSINDDFKIPESSFLNPIEIDNAVAEEVIRDQPGKDRPSNLVEVPVDNPTSTDSPRLNLTWARKTINVPLATPDPKPEDNSSVSKEIDFEDIKRRQMIAESAGNAKAVSRVGAKGLYQIMDPTHQDYIKATGDNGDLFDPEYNTRVRDWYMDWLGKNKIINTDGVSDFTKAARQLVAYNWGIGNLQKLLNKHRANGVDVDNSLDWLEGLPKETRDYVDKILLKNYALKSKTS